MTIAEVQKRLPERISADVWLVRGEDEIFIGWFNKDHVYSVEDIDLYYKPLTTQTYVRVMWNECTPERWIVEV